MTYFNKHQYMDVIGLGFDEIGHTYQRVKNHNTSPRIQRGLIGFALGAVCALILHPIFAAITSDDFVAHAAVMVAWWIGIPVLVSGAWFYRTRNATWHDELIEMLSSYHPVELQAYNDLMFQFDAGLDDLGILFERWFEVERAAIGARHAFDVAIHSVSHISLGERILGRGYTKS